LKVQEKGEEEFARQYQAVDFVCGKKRMVLRTWASEETIKKEEQSAKVESFILVVELLARYLLKV
jgi:hypothetical protein